MSWKKETTHILGGLAIFSGMAYVAYPYYMNDQARRDPETIQRQIDRVAPKITPPTLRPLTGQIPQQHNMPTGSFTMDFVCTKAAIERRLPPGTPKIVSCLKIMHRIQFDVMGATKKGELDLACRMEQRWRGTPGGDTMTGFPRPFNVIFHNPKQMYKNGIAFSINGFDPHSGEVYVGAYDKNLPTLYFTPNQHATIIYCMAESMEKRLMRDPYMYDTIVEATGKVYRGKMRPKANAFHRMPPLKRVLVPDTEKYKRVDGYSR